MGFLRTVFVVSLLPLAAVAKNFDGTTELTPSEKSEVAARVRDFYARPAEASLMAAHPPKFSLTRGAFVRPRPYLRDIKRTAAFRRYECEHFYKRHFPGIDCGEHTGFTPRAPLPAADAAIEDNDRVESLVQTWMERDELTRELGTLPTKGEIAQDVWSGDYWQMRWGLTSYRAATGVEFETYEEAIAAYKQPKEWRGLLESLSPKLLGDTVAQWSPAEKYDLSVGDETFTLTNNQKKAGEREKDKEGNVPDWIGLCDGWASASILVPPPTKSVDVAGPRGATVTWHPDDIRALATLSYANGQYEENFISGRCEEEKIALYPNGRIKTQDCFDSNPATFHLALANLIGKKHVPFIMDVSADAEIWNQPVLGYEMTYFNPLEPDKKGTDWSALAVPYDKAFKAKDRFQNPLTRGVRDERNSYDDSKIEKIVGVMATVVYLDEADPNWGPKAKPNSTDRVTYTYDLELSRRDGKLVPTGGEWHANEHPDFLWVPRKGTIARSNYDDRDLKFDIEEAASKRITRVARLASDDGAHPLCRVLQALVEPGNEKGMKYRCPGD